MVKTLIINRAEVRQLLPMNECIDAMAETFKMLNSKETIQPQRMITWLPEKVGVLAMMPAYLGDLNAMGVKVLSVFPGNHNTKYDSHQGMVMLFDTKNGRPLAIVDASEITAIRTAAASGVATNILAREDASDLVILGSGVQAQEHLRAILITRDIKRVRVWNPYPDLARQFAETESEMQRINIEPMEGEKADVKGADIICTVTPSLEPVLFGDSIPDGVHINAVGASQPNARELDTAAVVKSRMFVDCRESAIKESGDFLFAKKEGAVGDNHILGEIGEILLGKVEGRKSVDEITVFESLGMASEDVVAAQHVYAGAIEKGVGTSIEL